MLIAVPSPRRSAAAVAVFVALLLATSVVAPAGSGVLPSAGAHVPTAADARGCHTHTSGRTYNIAVPGTNTHHAHLEGSLRVDCTADVASWSGTVQVLRNGRVIVSEPHRCNEPAGAEQTFQCTWELRARDVYVPNGQISQWSIRAVNQAVQAGDPDGHDAPPGARRELSGGDGAAGLTGPPPVSPTARSSA